MQEKNAFKLNGFLAILVILLLLAGSVVCFIQATTLCIILGFVLLTLSCLLMPSVIIVPPNFCRVILFFGRYVGCIRESGVWFIIPFSNTHKVSLKVRNFNTEKIKVNDVNGNPIEIAAVIVFRVTDSAKAVFDVDNYEKFVEIQSETGLRHVAAQYPYDNFEAEGISLRGHADEVSKKLRKELHERLSVAGVDVIEVRLTHLAYATEIASAMLQRQQASAILAARQIIVEGAVGMAQMAIDQLEKEGVLKLDEERKMNMINNLLVSIVADRSSQPVINVGSLY